MPRGGESPAVLAKRKEDHEKRIERNADIMRSSKLLLKPDPKLKEIMDGNTLTVDRSSGHPRDTGLAKVVWASASSNARSQGFAGLTGFQRGPMPPAVFNEQLKRAFNCTLLPSELKEVFQIFDNDGNGTIDGAEFLVNFFKMGFSERQAQLKWRKDRRMRTIKREQAQAKKKEDKRDSFAEAQVDWDYTEKDKKSGMKKLEHAALSYMRNGTRMTGLAGLKGFQGAELLPMTFREQLKQAFGVCLTKKELGAMVHEIDLDQSGTIDGAEFLKFLFQVGRRKERALRKREVTKYQRAQLEKEIEELDRREEDETKAESLLSNWSRADQESAVLKVKTAAANYTQRQLGTAGLAAFDGNQMSPALFRRALHQTFGLQLTTRETAALVCYLDSDGDGTIDTVEFMAKFFWMKAKSVCVNPALSSRVMNGPDSGGGWTHMMPPIGKPGPTTGMYFAPGRGRRQAGMGYYGFVPFTQEPDYSHLFDTAKHRARDDIYMGGGVYVNQDGTRSFQGKK